MTAIQKRRLKVNFITLIALIFLIVAAPVLIILFKPNFAKAAWYDDGWLYRKSIVIGNTGAADSNKKVLIQIDTATLITAGQMQSDCGDSRFTDNDGAILQYYVSTTGGAGVQCNDASTDYYVLLASINGSTNNTVMYHYYGNPSAINGSQLANFSQATFSPTSGPTAGSEEKTTGPISYWNFDEGQGTTANDYSAGSNNDLTVASAIWKTGDLCIFGNCLAFDGSADYAIKTYSSDTELLPGTASFTISAWFKHSSTAGQDILIARAASVTGIGWKVYMNSSGYMCFGIEDTGLTRFPPNSICGGISYADTQWHLLTAVKTTTTTIAIFIDGKQAGITSVSAGGSLNGSNAPFIVGNDYDLDTFGWDGFIDEVKYYNFAKTLAQIQAEYNAKSAVKGASASFGAGDANTSLNQGLVGYWKMDETATPSLDSSGNGFSGTWTGSATYLSGKFGNSISLDGNGDWVSVADNAALDPSDDMTLSSWINLVALPVANSFDIAAKMHTVSPWESYEFYVDSGDDNVYFHWNNSSAVNWEDGWDAGGGGALTTGVWYHVVAVRKDKILQLYLNGEKYGNPVTTTGTIFNSNSVLAIGSDSDTLHFNGKIDETRLYNRALTPVEVAALYSWAPGPVGWWKMDENTGASANDTSGGAATGTLSLGPTWASGMFGSAISFDGVNDFVDIGTGPTVVNTASFWMYPTASTEYALNFTSTTDYIWVNAGTVTATGFTSPTIYVNGAVSSTVTTNAWNHVEVTSATSENASNFDIGRVRDAQYFTGKIDDVRLYSYPRSAKQIVEDMNAGHPAGGSPISSPIIYWKFDEMNGSLVKNSNASQSSLTGTFVGSPVWTTEFMCKLNGCLYFSGGSEYINAGDVSFVDSLTQMSATFWVSIDGAGVGDNIISKRGTNQNNFQIILGGTNTDFKICIAESLSDSCSNYFETSGGINDVASSHVAVIYDGTADATNRVRVYVDGKKKTGTITSTIPTSMTSGSTSNLIVGEASSYLDEVKIYNSALSVSEVLVDMNAGSGAAMGGVLGARNNEGFGGSVPVARWKMDDNTGSTAVDSSGNANTGTLKNSTTWAEGKIGSGLTFNGSQDYVNAGNGSTLNNLGIMTVEAWIYPRSFGGASFGRIIDKNVNDTNAYVYMYVNNDGVAANSIALTRICNTGFLDVYGAANSITLNKWQHVAATMDSGTNSIKMYVNGKDVSDVSNQTCSGGVTDDSANALFIGNRIGPSQNRGFDGIIDNLSIYNDVLTPAQIAYNYNRGAPVGWWKFDECQGTSALDTAPKANATDTRLDGTIVIGALGEDTVGDCTTTSTSWFNGATGKYNSSLDFDGTDDYMTIDYTSGSGTYPQFSVGVWVKWGTKEGKQLLINEQNTDTLWFVLDEDGNDKLDIYLGDTTSPGYHHSSQAITRGNWSHLFITYDDDTNELKLYINGILDSTKTTSGIPNFDTTLRIADREDDLNSENFDGQLDDIRLYRYPLTAVQVKTLYNQGSAVRFGPASGSP